MHHVPLYYVYVLYCYYNAIYYNCMYVLQPTIYAKLLDLHVHMYITWHVHIHTNRTYMYIDLLN